MQYLEGWLKHCKATEADIKRDNRGELFIMVECYSADETYKCPDYYRAYAHKMKITDGKSGIGDN